MAWIIIIIICLVFCFIVQRNKEVPFVKRYLLQNVRAAFGIAMIAIMFGSMCIGGFWDKKDVVLKNREKLVLRQSMNIAIKESKQMASFTIAEQHYYLNETKKLKNKIESFNSELKNLTGSSNTLFWFFLYRKDFTDIKPIVFLLPSVIQ